MEDPHVNGIAYEYHGGDSYSLYPIKGKDTPKGIQRAKYLIKSKVLSAKIQIRWKQPDDTAALPEKVPDNAIIKSLKVELGKKDAYIQELEEKMAFMQDSLKKEAKAEAREDRKQILKETLLKELETKNAKLKKENDQLRKTNSELVGRIYQNTK